MKVFDTPHKKKSAVLTLITAFLLIFLFFYIGLSYYDPPVSYGMEVNFGNSINGSGNNIQPLKQVIQKKSSSAENKPKVERRSESKPPQKKVVPKIIKPLLKDEKSTIPIINKNEVEKKSTISNQKKEEKLTKNKKPKVTDDTKNLVSNLIKNRKKEDIEKKGEGDDQNFGDKGKKEGNPYSSSYYNKAGLKGIGKGYGLNGRNLKSNGKVIQECNQEGIVVVRITVNKLGKVINAEPGVKGTTNTHPCLLVPAKKTALMHEWYPDSKAPEQQIGFVVIQFKLGE